MQINRIEFMNSLKSVVIGTSPKNIIEQSSCFVFRDGKVITFNDDIACILEADFGFEGALVAETLLSVLTSFPEEFVDVSQEGGELLISAKKRRAGITLQQEIALPIEHLESPGKLKKIPENFLDGLSIVAECASMDESQFDLSCVHITPKYVEATDNYQIARYEVASGNKEPCLLRASSVKKLPTNQITHYGLSDAWMHFKQDKLLISIRRYAGDFRDLNPYLGESGTEVHFPTDIERAVQAAKVFTTHRSQGDDITFVSLRDGAIVIEGRSEEGWYQEQFKANYKGEKVKFGISSTVLSRFAKKHSKCLLASGRLVVRDGSLVWAGAIE